MYPHYYKPQKPKPEWQRKLDTINPNAINTIGIGIITLYLLVAIVL